MSEPTKAAMKTARRMWPEAATLSVTGIAEFIDRETGLPELVAALKLCEFELGVLCRQFDAKGYSHGGPTRALNAATEALRKVGEL